jgi:hypothetical protein
MSSIYYWGCLGGTGYSYNLDKGENVILFSPPEVMHLL